MITPPILNPFVHLASTTTMDDDPSSSEAESRRHLRRTYITVFSSLAGLLLVGTLADLPLVIQGLLGGLLALVIYGTTAARLSQMRLGLLLGLVALTSFNLIHGLANFDFESQHQAIFWAQSASEEFQELFAKPEQYHLLADELFVSHAYWKKHAGQLKPLQGKAFH